MGAGLHRLEVPMTCDIVPVEPRSGLQVDGGGGGGGGGGSHGLGGLEVSSPSNPAKAGGGNGRNWGTKKRIKLEKDSARGGGLGGPAG